MYFHCLFFIKSAGGYGTDSLMYYSGITSLLPIYRASLGFLYVTVKNNQHFINCEEVASPFGLESVGFESLLPCHAWICFEVELCSNRCDCCESCFAVYSKTFEGVSDDAA